MTKKLLELNKDTDSHIILSVESQPEKSKYLIIEPILELYKGELYMNMLYFFINDCITTFGSYIFSIKKMPRRTITNLLSSWMFSLYINYDFSNDYFLPDTKLNMDFLKYTLYDLCKYDSQINNVEEKINKITSNLEKNYKLQIKLLNNYRNSDLFKNNKNNYEIKKSIINLVKYNDNSIVSKFYKFKLSMKFYVKNKKLQNILNNIVIPENVYNKLKQFYNGPKNSMDNIIWMILFRYQLLGSNNNQLAVLPHNLNQFNKDYGLNFECFASSINCTFSHYCSLYWDLERYFGSVGNFFNITPIKGTFGFNPPYQKYIIEKGVINILNFLDKFNDLTFIITIPIWDLEGQKIMDDKFNNKFKKQNIDYGDFDVINDIKKSQYFKEIKMIPKEEFTYIDYHFELYKNKTIQNTYVIILSNKSNYEFKLDSYIFKEVEKVEK